MINLKKEVKDLIVKNCKHWNIEENAGKQNDLLCPWIVRIMKGRTVFKRWIQMASKHKICISSLAIREMQIKNTSQFLLILFWMTAIKKTTTNAGKYVDIMEPLCTNDRNVWYSHDGNQQEFSKNNAKPTAFNTSWGPCFNNVKRGLVIARMRFFSLSTLSVLACFVPTWSFSLFVLTKAWNYYLLAIKRLRFHCCWLTVGSDWHLWLPLTPTPPQHYYEVHK